MSLSIVVSICVQTGDAQTFSGAIIDPQRRFVGNAARRAAEGGRPFNSDPRAKPDAHLQMMRVFG